MSVKLHGINGNVVELDVMDVQFMRSGLSLLAKDLRRELETEDDEKLRKHYLRYLTRVEELLHQLLGTLGIPL